MNSNDLVNSIQGDSHYHKRELPPLNLHEQREQLKEFIKKSILNDEGIQETEDKGKYKLIYQSNIKSVSRVRGASKDA